MRQKRERKSDPEYKDKTVWALSKEREKNREIERDREIERERERDKREK